MNNYPYTTPLLTRAEDLLLKLGVPPHLRGFGLLARATVLRANDPHCNLINIYTRIAPDYGITAKTVENLIYYVIYNTQNNIGDVLGLSREEMIVSNIIASLAMRIKPERSNK